MVVVWQLFDKDGGLITTCFKERDMTKARDRLEAKGHVVRVEKIFDAHLKDRPPVVKKTRVKKVVEPSEDDDAFVPKGYHEIVIYALTGDIINSELGICVERGHTDPRLNRDITRFIVTDKGNALPVKRIEDTNGTK